MESFAGMIMFFGILAVVVFAIGSLPMIWFHIGFVSRKLDKIIELLNKQKG